MQRIASLVTATGVRRLSLFLGLLILVFLASSTNPEAAAQLQPQFTPGTGPSDELAARVFPPLASRMRTDPRIQAAVIEARRHATPIDLATETRGKAITIAGKRVALPPDAYVEQYIAFADCAPPPPCAEVPAYTIARGQSRISVAVNSGRINGEQVAPGEPHQFQFLKDALR